MTVASLKNVCYWESLGHLIACNVFRIASDCVILAFQIVNILSMLGLC